MKSKKLHTIHFQSPIIVCFHNPPSAFALRLHWRYLEIWLKMECNRKKMAKQEAFAWNTSPHIMISMDGAKKTKEI